MKKSQFLFFIALLLFSGCGYKSKILPQPETMFKLNDTITIHINQTLTNAEDGFTIRFDSVTTDSRCPDRVICVWAGNAQTVFTYTNLDLSSVFKLNTYLTREDSINIKPYQVELIRLDPYPDANHPFDYKDYEAWIVVTKN